MLPINTECDWEICFLPTEKDQESCACGVHPLQMKFKGNLSRKYTSLSKMQTEDHKLGYT